MRVLVVAPWGDPGRWRSIRYVVDLPSEGFRDVSVSKEVYCRASSLAALHEAFERELGWECFSLVLLPATLAVNNERFYESIPSSFSELADLALSYVKSIAETKPVLPRSNCCIEVVPCIGLFPSRERDFETCFRGSIRVFYSAVYFTVLKALSRDDYDVVVLDLSHGVNFMPVATRSAVEYAVYAYVASRKNKRLYMFSYNSAPMTYPPGRSPEELPSLNIHLIESVKIDSKYAFRQLCDEVYSIVEYRGKQSFDKNKLVNIVDKKRARVLIKEYLSSIKRVESLSELRKLVIGLTDSLQNGLVLKLAVVLDKLSLKHLEALEEVIKKYSLRCEALSVGKIAEGRVHVEYNYDIEPRVRLVKLHALLYAVLKKVGEIGELSEDSWYSIDVLSRIEEEFIVDKVKKTIIRNELGNFKTRILGLKEIIGEEPLAKEEGVPYAAIHVLTSEARAIRLVNLFRKDSSLIQRIVRDLEDLASKTPLSYDERNFYAHAGLEQNIVKVKIKGNKILLKYRREV